MGQDPIMRRTPTRRDIVKGSGALAGGGLFAGCMENSSPDSTTNETSNSDSETEEESYSVTIEPVGEVTFDQPPESWFPFTGDYADMGVALGQGDGLLAMGIRERFASWYYDELPGVSVDRDSLTQLWQDGTDKEIFYELDADIHLIDPNFMINRIQWDQEDIDEIAEKVGPFFGNTIFSESYQWDNANYSLYEVFEKVAQVFQEEDRYEAFKELHENVISDVQSQLPETPAEVAVVFPRSDPPETFLPFVMGEETGFKQWHDLQVRDAFAESDVANFHENRAEIDLETLLEVDPEVIAIRRHGEITDEEFETQYVEPMKNHRVGSQLQAVQNDRVIYGGAPQQGPIVYLFQLEKVAKDLYPEIYTEDEFFERQHVADIVNGEFE